MLRTITSHASRRQRQHHQRSGAGAGSRIQASTGAGERDLHCGHDIAQSTSPALPLSCCLPCCSDIRDRYHRRDGITTLSRQYHSLSVYQPAAPSLSSLSINNGSSSQNPAANLPPLLTHPRSSAAQPTSTTTIQKRHKVFVSRHNNTFNLTAQSIISYITAHLPHLNPNSCGANGDFRVTNTHVIMKECPFCAKPTNGKVDNFYKLYIQIGGGAYFCHRCGAKGSWFDFKSEIGGFVVDGTTGMTAAPGGGGDGNDSAVWNRELFVNRPFGAGGGVGGGEGVAQPWNWNTSKNQGLSYTSTKQLVAHPGGVGRAANATSNQKVDPLPMPPKKLNSIYASKLFDPANSPTHNPEEYKALQYLTQTRGLSRSVLRKFGVGCAPYNFAEKNAKSGISYVSSMCVTFPWLMRSSEVAEQEELRGAEFVWKAEESTSGGNESADNGRESTQRRTRPDALESGKLKKKLGEMTALERYHYRRERNAAKQRQQDESAQANIMSTAGGQHIQAAQQGELTPEDVQNLHGPYIPRRIKVRSTAQKSWQRLDPPGGGFGLFGWHTVPHDATELILTEGEFDAMAVYQATGRPAVSLPNGCRSLPMEVLVLLERFDAIYLWMDDDGPGREGAEMFAKKLGVERCLVVRPSGKRGWNGGMKNGVDADGAVGADADDQHAETGGISSHPPVCTSANDADHTRPPYPPKDANEALLQGWDLCELLDEASELPHDRILKFSDLRDQVIHEIVNPEKYRGAPIPSLPGFTSLIKGFRRGEMTVLTGPTGSGKTTFLGQASLDLAEQGINILWGSFEIKNTRLMHKLLQQYMKDVLPVGLAEEDVPEEERRQQMAGLTALADKFETLPMHFMKFHGGSDVDDVLDAMEYAAYVHDVEHVILDNMQFMISRQSVGKGSSYDKFDMQDIAVEKFRKFATEYNVHVTLVVHPRKEDEGSKLGMSSFYGSAKATQEADTVIILQNDGKRKFVDVKKNRFDGTLGHVPLHFQRKSGRYSETPEANAPPRTVIPNGVSAMNGVHSQVNGTARASASASSVYHEIRNQHPY